VDIEDHCSLDNNLVPTLLLLLGVDNGDRYFPDSNWVLVSLLELDADTVDHSNLDNI
jgi:hypothetical protein